MLLLCREPGALGNTWDCDWLSPNSCADAVVIPLFRFGGWKLHFPLLLFLLLGKLATSIRYKLLRSLSATRGAARKGGEEHMKSQFEDFENELLDPDIIRKEKAKHFHRSITPQT